MIKSVSNIIKNLNLNIKQDYVIRYTKGKSLFDKTHFNEQWIPRQRGYHKSRKPRLTGWDDPNVVFPKLIPPLYKPCKHRHFVQNVVEEEQKQKAIRNKQYLLADIRSGDIVDLTFQQTYENPQTVTYRGLVLSFKRRNLWTAAIELGIRFGGMPMKCIFLIHSPKVKKIELISRGSGCFKSSLKPGWHKLNKTQLTTPKIRKRVMKLRKLDRKRKVTAKKQLKSIKYDQIVTDNVRRLV